MARSRSDPKVCLVPPTLHLQHPKLEPLSPRSLHSFSQTSPPNTSTTGGSCTPFFRYPWPAILLAPLLTRRVTRWRRGRWSRSACSWGARCGTRPPSPSTSPPLRAASHPSTPRKSPPSNGTLNSSSLSPSYHHFLLPLISSSAISHDRDRDRLEDMLRAATLDRRSVGRVMVFCVGKADAAEEVPLPLFVTHTIHSP